MMQTPTPPRSLKRKRHFRATCDPDEPSPTRAKTREPRKVWRRAGSPRTSVAGDMQRLQLQENGAISELEESQACEPPSELDMVHSVRIFRSPSLDSDSPGQANEPWLRPLRLDGIAQSSAFASQKLPANPWRNEIPETPTQSPTAQKTSGPPELVSRHDTTSPPPTLPALWWSEEDLTGQNRDPQDSGDDGEGINGIGFVPTAAIAYARSEKRRRQIRDWKERENREARVKRGQRRRRREDDTASDLPEQPGRLACTRKVRFLET